jgi:hypothetical protein
VAIVVKAVNGLEQSQSMLAIGLIALARQLQLVLSTRIRLWQAPPRSWHGAVHRSAAMTRAGSAVETAAG